MSGNPVSVAELKALLDSCDPEYLKGPALTAHNKLMASVVVQQLIEQDMKITQHDGEMAVAEPGDDHALRVLKGQKRLESAAPLVLPELTQLQIGEIFTILVARGLHCRAINGSAVVGQRPFASEIMIALKAAWQVGHGQKEAMAAIPEPDGPG